MRIIRFLDAEGQVRLGQETEDGQARVLSGDLYGDLQATDQILTPAKPLAPVEPTNIFCIGLNYREHAIESGAAIPDSPVVFMKPTSTLCHPGDPIRLPACQHNEEVDYECELAVIIGQAARNVSKEEALKYVLGYTCGHDVSARHWQMNGGGGQWIKGKGFDTFCPLGPVLVTADEIPDPQALAIRTYLNGEVMQNHTTGDMIFSVAEVISFLSLDTTLLPGTVILTGTPQGVGFARKPPVWLKAGDEVVIELEGIGRLSNPVAGPA
ncbi:MAG: DUF2437 domain-containing protein [Candidatus Latescibacteria bacterium]|nr:DUF2437 domain-containing protein [Candidatus Latescibacterota bacterium]